MGKFAVGDIVLIDFPYSDFTKVKKRPALVIGLAEFDNVILCQITSSPFSSNIAIKLEQQDIINGALPVTSYVRPDKIFTIDAAIIHKSLGVINTIKLNTVKNTLMRVFEYEK